jgi:hypothetical protein
MRSLSAAAARYGWSGRTRERTVKAAVRVTISLTILRLEAGGQGSVSTLQGNG